LGDRLKRFTDTDIWQKEWFMNLTTTEKAAWYYLCSACDNVGVWTPNFRLANFQIGADVHWEKLIESSNGNIKKLGNGKWWLVDFCTFQHPDLKEESTSPAVRSYIILLEKHGLFQEYIKGIGRLPVASKEREQEKAKVQVRVKAREKEGENGTKSNVVETTRNVIGLLNERGGFQYDPEAPGNRTKIKRLLTKGYTEEQMKKVVAIKCKKWKGDPKMDDFLRPSTLFGPEKFDDYVGEYDHEVVKDAERA
jgi:uncharacterized phage protein (TIGR02220 family)